MDKVSEFINKARSLGQTDDQIKQTLLDKGWTISAIDPYFSAPTAIENTKRMVFPNRFLFATIICICLVVIGIGITVAIINSSSGTRTKSSVTQSLPVPTTEPTIAPVNTSDNTSELLTFIQYGKDPTSAVDSEATVILFDLNQKKALPTDPLLSSEKNASPVFGHWSPDGRYLPILYIRPSGELEPLFFFDSVTKTSRKVYTFVSIDQDKYVGLSTDFWLNNRWLDDARLVFYREGLVKSSPKEFAITIDGTISEMSRRNELTLKNSRITVTEDTTPGSNETKSIMIDGEKYNSVPKGQVIGMVKDEMVSLETPAADMQDLTEDSELSMKIYSATSDEERSEIINEAMKPKGNWLLHFYDPKSGLETRSHEIQSEGWQVIEVQIRPKKNTIIMMLKEKAVPPYAFRLVEVETENMIYRTIGETPQSTSYPQLTLSSLGEYFNLNSDGEWLLSYDGQMSELVGGIVARNLSTGEKVTICEKQCSHFRIFNPTALTQR